MVVGSWEANGIADGKRSLEGNQHTSRIKATFAEDGTLTGTDGCNDYSASYRIDDQVMRIRKIRIERRQCGRPHRRNARRYYAALRATRTWSITMFGFTLHDDRGVMQVTLGPNQAAPEPEPSS
jgi:heat shock protein HslJ